MPMSFLQAVLLKCVMYNAAKRGFSGVHKLLVVLAKMAAAHGKPCDV